MEVFFEDRQYEVEYLGAGSEVLDDKQHLRLVFLGCQREDEVERARRQVFELDFDHVFGAVDHFLVVVFGALVLSNLLDKVDERNHHLRLDLHLGAQHLYALGGLLLFLRESAHDQVADRLVDA